MFLAAALGLVVPAWHSDTAVLIAAGIGATLALLPLDLGERGMLGDAGANFLGYVVGAGLLAALPVWGLGVALALVLALHAAAETVTLSRLIRAATPLRWLDDLGRSSVRMKSRSA